jgi:HJR/Mrr/RecB family endonuclease
VKCEKICVNSAKILVSPVQGVAKQRHYVLIDRYFLSSLKRCFED